MANSFKKLSDPIDRDPARRARVESHKRAIEVALELAGARGQRGVSQTELAKRMKVSQANISRIEREGDIQLSTLANYVGALGGELRIEAVFDNASVALVGGGARQQARQERAETPTASAGARAGRAARSKKAATTSKRTATKAGRSSGKRTAKR